MFERPMRGVTDQLGAVAQVQLFTITVTKGPDGPYARVQLRGDVGGLHRLADEPKNLQVAIGKTIDYRLASILSALTDGAMLPGR